MSLATCDETSTYDDSNRINSRGIKVVQVNNQLYQQTNNCNQHHHLYANDPNLISQKIRIKRPKSSMGPFYQQTSASSFNIAAPTFTNSNSNNANTSFTNSSATHSCFFKQISHKQDKYSYFSKKESSSDDSKSKNNNVVLVKSNRSVSSSSTTVGTAESTSNLNATFKAFKLSSSWQKQASKKNLSKHSSSNNTSLCNYKDVASNNFSLYKDTHNFLFSRLKSKSVNEESPDYESIKALRDSVDSLNYKFDDALAISTANTTGCSSNTNLATSVNNVNQFRINPTEINKDFVDFDLEFNFNNWADLQSEEFLQGLNKQSRNKQENIFEFIKTEVSYLKILTITQKVYVNAMLSECKIDQKIIQQMFPDLDKLIELHKNLLDQLMERYKISENKYIESIGDIMLNILTTKYEEMIEIYSKVCCMHLSAKSLYKQLSLNNKTFINFLQECRKHQMLRRYQIPDCLTIITQRLTKYLTLIENMVVNSKENKNDFDLLTHSLEKLRAILTRVNDAVAFYQNTVEFKKLLDQIDSKSFTYFLIKLDKQFERKKFMKNDLVNKTDLKILSLNHVVVKSMSKNGKVYKDVTCLTLNDMIIFLQLNDKSKYVFMNENSVIPCTNGILIRPKVNEITQNRPTPSSSSNSTLSNNSHSLSISNLNSTSSLLTPNNSFTTSNNTNNSSHFMSQSHTCANMTNQSSTSSSGSILPTYIVNTITNEIIEIKFSDEISRNQWLTLVHTHITPFIEENTLKDDTSSSHLESFSNHNGSANQSILTGTGTSSSSSNLHYQNSCSSNGSFNSISQIVNKNFKLTSSTGPVGSVPSLTANTHRCNSNISHSSSSSSGQGSYTSTSSGVSNSTKRTSLLSQNAIEALNLSDSAMNIHHSQSIVSSPTTNNTNTNASVNAAVNGENLSLISCDMQLSPDLANILYSFNNLFDHALFPANLIRSASSAGETVTRNSQEVHASVPKRAETFNGASSKECPMSNININADILKSRVYKNAISASCIHHSDHDKKNENRGSKESGKMNKHHHHHHHHHRHHHNGDVGTNTDLSADSGYHSRLCVDQNHDTDPENCSCTFIFESGTANKNFNDQRLSENCEALDQDTLLEDVNQQNTSQASMPKAHFESILKFILDDYMRLKNENENLRTQLSKKDKSIDTLKSTMEECKNQLDTEKKDLQKKYVEIEKKEDLNTKITNLLCNNSSNQRCRTSSASNMLLDTSISTSVDITNLLSSSSRETLSSESLANIVSILVKCEPNLIKSNEDESGTKSSKQTITSMNKISSVDSQKPPIPVKVYQTTTQTQTEKVTTVKSESVTMHYHKRSSSRTIQSSESSV